MLHITTPLITLHPWRDPTAKAAGHRPSSTFARTCWLPILGPTCWLLWADLADALEDAQQQPVELDLYATCHRLGIKQHLTRNGALGRTLTRLTQLRMVAPTTETSLAVRLYCPPLTLNQRAKLPRPAALRYNASFDTPHAC